MNHLLKIIALGVLTLILFTSTVSALELNISSKTDTTIELTITPSLNASLSPDIYVNNNLIQTPIRDKLILDNLIPDTIYYITLYFNNPESEYYGEYYRIECETEPSEQLQLSEVIYQYGYILMIVGVLSLIAYSKLPFGGVIPLFLSLLGAMHYIKYDNNEPAIIIMYGVLMIISSYLIYIRGN